MKKGKLLFIILFIICMPLCLTSCTSNKDNKENYVFDFSRVTLFSQGEDGAAVYKINESALKKVGMINGISGFNYNIKNSIYVYVKNISMDENLQNNEIIIYKQNKEKKLTDFHTAIDVKMCFSGEKIAFRSFKGDDIKTVQPLKIYNIQKEKYEVYKSDVLISGNMYQWINDDTLAYYGSKDGVHDKIYMYDFKENKEKVLMNKINGYITFFKCINNQGVLFLEEGRDENNLCYMDFSLEKKSIVTSQISHIEDAVVLSKGEVFFIGTNMDENKELLYEFKSFDGTLKRINYDFPKKVDKNDSLAEYNDKVYFCGFNDNNEESLYMFDNNQGTVNFICKNTGKLFQQGK